MRAFFDAIVELFESDPEYSWAKEALEWWNVCVIHLIFFTSYLSALHFRQVFGSGKRSNATSTTTARVSAAKFILAQRAARIASIPQPHDEGDQEQHSQDDDDVCCDDQEDYDDDEDHEGEGDGNHEGEGDGDEGDGDEGDGDERDGDEGDGDEDDE